jgi:hypothetical protein
MGALVMWLFAGCAKTIAPPPVSADAHAACVEDCYQHRQMQAISVEAIREACSTECTAENDPPSLWTDER